MPESDTAGSCFPKDMPAFIAISDQLGTPFNLLREVQRINEGQKARSFKTIARRSGCCAKRISDLGSYVSSRTPTIYAHRLQSSCEQLLREGAHVVAYDPKGMHKARAIKR